MKYAMTSDGIIHQVTDEKVFYEHNPKAQDVTLITGVYKAFEKQQAISTVKRVDKEKLIELLAEQEKIIDSIGDYDTELHADTKKALQDIDDKIKNLGAEE